MKLELYKVVFFLYGLKHSFFLRQQWSKTHNVAIINKFYSFSITSFTGRFIHFVINCICYSLNYTTTNNQAFSRRFSNGKVIL